MSLYTEFRPNGEGPGIMSLYTEFDHWSLPIGADYTPFGFLESLRDESVRESRPIGWSQKLGGFWVVAGYPEAEQIFRDPKTFSNRVVSLPQYKLPSGRKVMLGEYDPPEHTQYRRLIQPPFSPGRAAALTDHLRADATLLIDKFIGAGRVNVTEELAGQIGGRLVAMLCGLPPEDGTVYRSWVKALVQTKLGLTPEASANLKNWNQNFDRLLEERRANPGDDVMSMIVHATIDGRPLEDDEIRDYFTIILLGTIDNFQFFLSTVVWRMGWDVELRRRLITRPDLIPTAVDEFLRYYSSGGESRYVAETIEIGGVTMRPGQILTMQNNLINRDSRQFPYPDVFIPDRAPNKHLGLGFGIHRCLGVHLASVVTKVFIETVLDRIPEYELDPATPPVWHCGQISGFESVTILFPPGKKATELA
jgi:cytochrome P450